MSRTTESGLHPTARSSGIASSNLGRAVAFTTLAEVRADGQLISENPWNDEEFVHHRPDAHWQWQDRGGQPLARCSLWWTSVPCIPGERVGVIGHYAAANSDAAVVLLRHVSKELSRQGATWAVGPMDGNTWRNYRLVTETNGERPFFLEPVTPIDSRRDWIEAGFETFARYSSRLNTALGIEDVRGAELFHEMEKRGIQFRQLDLTNFDAELAHLFPLIQEGFRSSVLYTPLDFEAFRAHYVKLRPLVNPALITIAEEGAVPVGLLFGIPDYSNGSARSAVTTSIIKTLVIARHRNYAGLGSALAVHHHRVARGLGYSRVIHALMHEASKSQSISARSGQVMRRYELLAKRL